MDPVRATRQALLQPGQKDRRQRLSNFLTRGVNLVSRNKDVTDYMKTLDGHDHNALDLSRGSELTLNTRRSTLELEDEVDDERREDNSDTDSTRPKL
jgi:hypothetical protein